MHKQARRQRSRATRLHLETCEGRDLLSGMHSLLTPLTSDASLAMVHHGHKSEVATFALLDVEQHVTHGSLDKESRPEKETPKRTADSDPAPDAKTHAPKTKDTLQASADSDHAARGNGRSAKSHDTDKDHAAEGHVQA